MFCVILERTSGKNRWTETLPAEVFEGILGHISDGIAGAVSNKIV